MEVAGSGAVVDVGCLAPRSAAEKLRMHRQNTGRGFEGRGKILARHTLANTGLLHFPSLTRHLAWYLPKGIICQGLVPVCHVFK